MVNILRYANESSIRSDRSPDLQLPSLTWISIDSSVCPSRRLLPIYNTIRECIFAYTGKRKDTAYTVHCFFYSKKNSEIIMFQYIN